MTTKRTSPTGVGRRPFVARLAEELPPASCAEPIGRSRPSAGGRSEPSRGATRKTAIQAETTDDD